MDINPYTIFMVTKSQEQQVPYKNILESDVLAPPALKSFEILSRKCVGGYCYEEHRNTDK